MMRRVLLAGGAGAAAGAVTAVVFLAMERLTDLVSGTAHDAPSPVRILLTILLGGVLIAALRRAEARFAPGEPSDGGLADQIAAAADPTPAHARQALYIGAIAVVSVGFGGALGPEAGLVAVATELSAIVAAFLARDAAERRMIGAAGAAGALGGFYASPPGGALVAGDPQEGERLPRTLVFLAAVAGLFGFLLTLHLMPGEGGGVVVALPDYQPARDGRDMVASVIPALLGGAAGLGFVGLLPHVQALLSRLGGQTVQELAGTAGFAVLAALWPALRFSGHHELLGKLDWGAAAGPLPLLALAALKVLALCLCLAAGWRGGANFLLLFVGAAVGAAVTLVLPMGSSPTVALLAAMMAAATVGMGKPVAAVLIVAFLASPTTVGALSVGALVGFGLARLGPPPRLH